MKKHRVYGRVVNVGLLGTYMEHTMGDTLAPIGVCVAMRPTLVSYHTTRIATRYRVYVEPPIGYNHSTAIECQFAMSTTPLAL